MEFQGVLVKKIEQREGDSQRGHWVIASYLLEQEGMYPKRMSVEVNNTEFVNRIGMFDCLIGKRVVVRFDIDAREYNGKWYNSMRAFEIREDLTEAEKEERKKERNARRQRSELGTIESPEGKTDANETGTVADAGAQEGTEETTGEGDDEEKKDDLPF